MKPTPDHVRRNDAAPSVSPGAASSGASLHPSEGSAAAAAATPMGALLARHVLRDGETVILAIKPSLWFILLSSLRFLTVVALLMLIVWLNRDTLRHNVVRYVEVGIFLAAGRVVWAVLQWIGRLYILTDLRILRVAGVFSVEIFDCPLRKIASVRLNSPAKERCLRVGTIEITPQDSQCPPNVWQTVARPYEIHQKITTTINKARQC